MGAMPLVDAEMLRWWEPFAPPALVFDVASKFFDEEKKGQCNVGYS